MLLKILLIICGLFCINCWNVEEIPEKFALQVRNLQISNSTKNLEKFYSQTKTQLKSNPVFCKTCSKVVDVIIKYRKHADKESMDLFFKKLCYSISNWGDEVCDGYIDIGLDTVLYILDNTPNLTSDRFCGIYYQAKNCQDPNPNNWTIDLPPLPTEQTNKNPPELKAGPLKILHLTDIHYDPLYEPGSNADCGLGLCCQKCNGPPSNPTKAAGYWGDYHVCDMPWHSILNLIDEITTKHRYLDYIYYTGDIISHKSWATTKDDNIDAIKKINNLFYERFNGTQVVPILGNHEPHPTDFFSPRINRNFSTQWVFEVVNEEWSKWLPATTKETINTGGYYTFLVWPGYRAIVLNSNVCYTSNLWLIYDDKDPFGQLKWLVGVLTEAEKNHEKVHILSHIPPGEIRCLNQWSIQFRRIVNRFASIITAQFNGHTHIDELRLFYDSNNENKLINVAYNGGSFTTFVGMNPNYRIYTVDTGSFKVLDYDQYTYNLTKANKNRSKPEWYKLYSFKEAYGLKTANYEDLDSLAKRMANNSRLVQQYFRFGVRESDPKMSEGCNELCLRRLFCTITSVQADEALDCAQLK